MNRIIISKNKLENYTDEFISIQEHVITFQKNGDYTLEYIESDDIKLDIIIPDQVCVKLFIWSVDQKIRVKTHYKLGNFSNLLLFQFYCNKSVDENVIIDLEGEYSKISSSFSSISIGNDEYHIVVNHHNHHVTSSISNKCIGLDKSKIHFQIDSLLDKGNIGCVMDQPTRIFNLDDVDATVIPRLFLSEDSVEARHGGVIGSFREEDIFYFMSRGISRKEAMLLLIKGFLFSNFVVDTDKRGRILECIRKIWG